MQPSFLNSFEDRLNLAVHDINQEFRMSLSHLKEMMGGDVTMKYSDQGEVYARGDVQVEVPNGSSPDVISQALANPFDYKKKLVTSS